MPPLCRALAIVAVLVGSASAAPLGSGFIYQGQLKHDGQAVTGTVVASFALYDALTGGNLLGTQSEPALAVTGGLFTVTLNAANQFGTSPFDGQERWLQITIDGQLLSPRQPLTAAPYALYAQNAAGLKLPMYGLSPAPSGLPALHIENRNADGVALLGEAGRTTGSPRAVWGKVNGIGGHAGYFEGAGFFSGPLGIGTTKPDGKFEVVDAAGGDVSVRLPTDSIGPAEVFAEPGLASSRGQDACVIAGTGTTNLVSQQITCPTAGMVVAMATGEFTVTAAKQIELKISDVSGGADGRDTSRVVSLSANQPMTTTVHSVFSVTSGAKTFHFLLINSVGVCFDNARLTLLFFPTTYGATTAD